MRATVIGGGSWGTALASVLGNNGHEVVIWSFEQDVAEAIAARRENPKYMPGVQLPQSVTAMHDLPRSLAGAELVLAVNPSHVTRPVMRQALPSLPQAPPIITRGLAELVRLAVRKGANPITLSGLAGMGDLVLTCTGELSRNRTVGLALGRGQKLTDVLAGMTQVAEGVRTAKSVHDLSRKLGVDMPLHDAVYRILSEDLPAKTALQLLTARELKSEFQLH